MLPSGAGLFLKMTMPRGGTPLSKATLEARGSWRAAKAEPQLSFPPGRPTCPDWLGPEAKAEWRRQVQALEAAGVLALVDRALLAAYCDAWGEFRELVERLDLDRDAWRTRSQKNLAAERLLKLAAQFGFAPAARARIKAPGTEEQSSGGKARYFAG